MLTFTVEPWSALRPIIFPFWARHYLEIARDQDAVPLDPDWGRYEALDAGGSLLIVAARNETGELKGYLFAIISTHLHYRSTLCAFFDLYWLEPDVRKGWNGVRLFRETERILKQLGVRKVFGQTKTHKDVGLIFRRLGWSEAEIAYTKVI